MRVCLIASRERADPPPAEGAAGTRAPPNPPARWRGGGDTKEQHQKDNIRSWPCASRPAKKIFYPGVVSPRRFVFYRGFGRVRPCQVFSSEAGLAIGSRVFFPGGCELHPCQVFSSEAGLAIGPRVVFTGGCELHPTQIIHFRRPWATLQL